MSARKTTDGVPDPVHCMAQVRFHSTIRCPLCGHETRETMPENACIHFYDCQGCGEVLQPMPGDCCVFCSWGDTPCPPVQVSECTGELKSIPDQAS